MTTVPAAHDSTVNLNIEKIEVEGLGIAESKCAQEKIHNIGVAFRLDEPLQDVRHGLNGNAVFEEVVPWIDLAIRRSFKKTANRQADTPTPQNSP
jgi:hypothetical protein